MYGLTFAFRSHAEAKLRVEDCIIAANHILKGAKQDRMRYLCNIDEFIRPMVQLPAGLHCNIEKLDCDSSTWVDYFKYDDDMNTAKRMPHKTKTITEYFIKVTFYVSGQLDLLNLLDIVANTA